MRDVGCSTALGLPFLQTCDEDRPGDWSLWKSASYATAVFPTLALLNHSCDPNITKVFSGTFVYVVAGRNINKGTIVVCDNCHFASK